MRPRTRPLTIRILALVGALALVAAACGEEADEPGADVTDDGVDAPAEDVPADDEAEDAPDEEAAPADAAVALEVASTDLGDILVDADGMTLYLFTQDPPGESVCDGDCAEAWPPLTADGEVAAGAGVDDGLVATVTRDDGTDQVTYADQPLYYFAADGAAGDLEGQGVNDVWFVVAPDGSAVENGGDEDAAGTDGGGMGY